MDALNPNSLAAHLCEAVAEDGIVRVDWGGWDPSATARLRLEVGGTTVPFRIVDAPKPRGFRRRLEVTCGIDPQGAFAVSLDELDEWRLPDSPTAQVHITRPSRPCTVPLAQPVAVPPDAGPVRFRAGLAAHRAEAELVLRSSRPNDEGVSVWFVPFDPRYFGGTDGDAYDWIGVPLGRFPQGCALTVELSYHRAAGDLSSGNPFLFVTKAEVGPIRADSMLEPAVASGLGEVPRQVLEAELTPSVRGLRRPVRLVYDEETIELVPAAAPTLEIREDFGHTIVVAADAACKALLYLDGTAAAALSLQEGDTPVRIPPRWLTGEPVLVEIRDRSGCQNWLQTYVLAPRQLTPTELLAKEHASGIWPHLFPQSEFRYRALRAHLADPRSAPLLDQLPRAIAVLEAGHDRVEPFQLRFPAHEAPDASVVIPAHNRFAVTFSCLCALLLAHNRATFEVVIVDDGSTDETAAIERWVEGVEVVRNPEPQRFLRACNAGVAAARGRHVVLLNNDTEPTAGWLDAMIEAFARFDRVGLVGAKLLYPDGRLQEAGGIVWRTGNPWNYGTGENPWEPRFSYARQVDYLSGAALMTSRAVWDEVGGLSNEFEPMYFEDTDLAFKIREAGYGTWFVPGSVVFHWEGTTSGRDVSSGFKRFQEVNRPLFKRRWTRAFKNHGPEGHAPDLEKDRGVVGRVLFVDATTPRPDHEAGGYAAVQEMRLVQSLGFKVTFAAENMAHMASHTEALQKMGVEVVYAPFYMSLSEFLAERGREFDAFYITRYHVASACIDQIREVAPRARILLNNADLHFLRQLRSALASGDETRLAEAAAVRDKELAVMRRVDAVLSYNDVEHAVIQSHTNGQVRVMTCPWVVELPERVAAPRERDGMSFLGSFRHPPNVEGINWFAREVMPALEATCPDARLTIYGSSMNEAVRSLASDRIRPHGFVEDVAEAYDNHRVFVAPLRSGAGIKGKVVAALAHGIPCVLSPTAAEGIGLRHRCDCLIAESVEDWVAAIGTLMVDDDLWRRLSESGRELVAHRFSFERGRQQMRTAFEAVDLFGIAD